MTAASSCLEERMGKLEKSYAEALQSSSESIKKTQEINYSAKAILKRQLEARKNNAIMYGVVEKESSTTLMQVKELMKNESFKHDSFCLGKQPVNVIRLQLRSSFQMKPANGILSNEQIPHYGMKTYLSSQTKVKKRETNNML